MLHLYINKNNILIGLLILLLNDILNSQHYECGSKITLASNYQILNNYISKLNILSNITPRSPIEIQVVIHNLWNSSSEIMSDERILRQIETLNNDFNGNIKDKSLIPIEFRTKFGSSTIHFCIASKIENDKNIIGIIRRRTELKEFDNNKIFFDSLGGSSPWDQEKYLNIWVANIGEFISGYSSFPWLKDSINDGVVISTNYFGENPLNNEIIGRVLTHEIGHYLGLIHIWGDSKGCDHDDGILDTPLQDGPYYGCPIYPQNGCSENEMFMNFMDYTNDPCMFMFTKQQVSLMENTIVQVRKNLINDMTNCNHSNTKQKILKNFYPNPVRDKITLLFLEEAIGIININIYDLLGKQVKTYSSIVYDKLEFDISELINGIYIIKLNQDFIKVCKM